MWTGPVNVVSTVSLQAKFYVERSSQCSKYGVIASRVMWKGPVNVVSIVSLQAGLCGKVQSM